MQIFCRLRRLYFIRAVIFFIFSVSVMLSFCFTSFSKDGELEGEVNSGTISSSFSAGVLNTAYVDLFEAKNISSSVSTEDNLNYNEIETENIEEELIEDNSNKDIGQTEKEKEYNTEELALLSTTIYLEASPTSDLEGCLAVGWVVRNRLDNKDVWKSNSYAEIIHMKEPVQFAVTLRSDFLSLQNEILLMDTNRARTAVEAAKLVLDGENPYNFPKYVHYFYGDMDKREWGNLNYYGTFGGNSYFYDSSVLVYYD